MTKSSMIVLVILLLGIANSQTVNLNEIFKNETLATLGPQYQSPDFLRTIDNYFGCKTWKDGFCLECSFGYIFNKNGVCCLVDRNCQVFNRDVGVCQHCYNGFFINAQGTCTAYDPKETTFTGCSKWEKNVCTQCSAKYYFNTAGVCTPISDQCRFWNKTTGECTDCYFGYIVDNGACVVDPKAPGSSNVEANPLCHKWGANGCESCANRAYFDAHGICQKVDNQCWTWDNADGRCLSCYPGYDLTNGTCVFSPSNTAIVTDPGCKTWKDGICLQCSKRWVFNKLGVCVTVEEVCKTHDDAGLCQTCYNGYALINGTCIFSSFNNAKPTDPGCSKWNWDNQTCLECSFNWVQDSNGFCSPVKEDCRTHDAQGLCTGCYKGYAVVNGSCIFSSDNNLTPPQKGCKIWNWDLLACQQCSYWWYIDSSKLCAEVSPLCATYDVNGGSCTSCYKGYALQNGVCVQQVKEVTDKGCKAWNGSLCLECSFNWVFNPLGACVSVSDLCKTHDQFGNCLTCYRGYGLVNGSCIYNEVKAQGGCNDWNWSEKKCLSCANNWVMTSAGDCAPVSDQCRTYNDHGWCTSCFRGYELHNILDENNQTVGVSCVYSPSNTAHPSDLGCKIWNWTTLTCNECSFNWFFDVSGKCAEASPYCKSHDALTGRCLTCFRGYDLLNGTCEYSSSNQAAPSDPGCSKWNGAACLECSQNWAFNSQGICQRVSDSCKTHEGFACTSCYNGFVLHNGTCELSPLNTLIPTDAGCKTWNWNEQICQECAPYWFMNQGVCLPVNNSCHTYDSTNGNCLSCFKGYSLVNFTCVRAADKPVTDAGCAKWVWDNDTCLECSPYWFFKGGVCTQVSPYCKTYDPATGACLSCYSGYSLLNGACELSPVSFCKTIDLNGCTTCFDGFVLYKNNCITLDSIANIALYYAECCPQKLAQLKAEGRIPQ